MIPKIFQIDIFLDTVSKKIYDTFFNFIFQ